MRYNTAQPYLAAYVLLRRKNTVACVLRSNTDWMNNYYGLPSGKVEVDETATTAAAREALEEVGVKIKENDLTFAHVCHRKADDDTIAWIDIIFEVSKWEGEPFNAEPDVHSKLEWLDIDKLPDNVIPAVRFYLEKIKEGRVYSEFEWD